MITVFTPSYNRKNELKKLYESLLNQKDSNFEWLIVDDGSKDDTEKYVKKISLNKKIKIRYIYKENGGKQSAYNIGVENAKGEIFLCIDSDDILVSNSLKKIENDFKQIEKKKDVGGIMYMQSYISNPNQVIGTYFPNDLKYEYYYNVYGKHKVKGDKLIVLKTSVASKYLFPIIEGEKFVPEALIFNRISMQYKMKLSNNIMAMKDYLNDGYSSNYFNLVKRNPKGNSLYFKEKYDIDKSLYNIYGYILFSIYSKYSFKYILSNHKSKFRVFILYLPTMIISKIK